MIIVAVVISLAVASLSQPPATTIPSSPEHWGKDMPLPEPSEYCPGGSEEGLLKYFPENTSPLTPEAYAAQEGSGLTLVSGVLPTDNIYPYRYEWHFPDGKWAGQSGFMVVRDGCLIHIQATLFDN